MLPVFICLLATAFPFFRQTFAWLEFKFSDLLFSSLPVLNQLTGRPGLVPPPVLIINKDQTFFQRFQRDPDRGDMARLLNRLAAEKATVVAIDFIYDYPADPDKDAEFSAALASFPLPVMATHFSGRGMQTFEKFDLIDSSASRPPLPVPLYRPLADKAAASALINIAADLDSTVRFAPLAFHPADSEDFIPGLGFAAWVATLVDQQATAISTAARLPEQHDAAENSLQIAKHLLATTIASGPFELSSTGHAGLDKTVRQLEARFIARILAGRFPELGETLKTAAAEVKVEELPRATWLKMPTTGIPVIGDYHMPCLRLPFKKTPPPLKGDGIEKISLGTLLETDSDKASALLNHRNLLKIEPGSQPQKFQLAKPQARNGHASITGQVISAALSPVASAEVLLTMPENGYWQLSQTDRHGNFLLAEVPAGSYTIQATWHLGNGWQRGICKGNARGKETVNLPTLVFAEPAVQVRIPANSNTKAAAKATVFGEPMPMLTGDDNGCLPFAALPQGFSISALDEDLSLTFASGALRLADGTPARNITLAVLPEDDCWTLRF
ncbi:MAG: CHASE2 domain-containing protein, partial [Candidatus Riflebacteria bacterium]|nr:CHASE2 domain-containing protein [Candidatus Riflebacteria bacterium]